MAPIDIGAFLLYSLYHMQAVILCAGLGTRLRPLTNTVPKAMAPIGDRPLLWHQIEHLKRHGIREIFINLHYLPESITGYFGDGSAFGVKITYSHEPVLLGTAGGLKQFEHQLGEDFLLVYGDVFNKVDYRKLIEYYRSKQPCLGVHVVAKTEHSFDSDLAALDGAMRFQAIYQKPHAQLPAGDFYDMQGIYVFNKKILDSIPEGRYYEIDHQLLPDILKRSEPYYGYPVQVNDYVHDIGTPDRYDKVK